MTTINQLRLLTKDGKLYRLVEIRNYEPNAKERLSYKYQVEIKSSFSIFVWKKIKEVKNEVEGSIYLDNLIGEIK